MIDTHAHLMFEQFETDLDQVIQRAKDVGLTNIINIACNKKTSLEAIELLKEDDFFYATLGVHPYDAVEINDVLLNEWEKLIEENNRIVAIGECGLDYFKAKVPKDLQKKVFRMQLEFAEKFDLPVVVHNREADDDCLEILSDYKAKVVFHCYGSDLKYAEKLWNRGYMTSFTGIITFPKSDALREVVKNVPLDKFMVETDCPYLAPQKYRGQRNEPSFVVEIIKEIAEIKSLDLKLIEEQSVKNSLKFFIKS